MDNIRLTFTRNHKLFYRIVLWISLLISIFALIRLSPVLSKPEYLPSDDFVPYWSSGRLNLQGDNPFDPQKTEQLQLTAGGIESGSYTISIVLNPPWAITLLMPFGFFAYPSGRIIWLIISILILIISSNLLWQLYSANPKQRWLSILAVFIFAPTISMLEVGQIGYLILIGLTGFLYYAIYRKKDWLAGIFLAIASIKPQVALLFWIILLLWIIQQHRWVILLSTSIYVLLFTFIAFVFNPHILQQYLGMLHTYHISEWANPTIGAYLRFFLFGTDKFWLQFLPSILGGVGIVFYWYVHRNSWNWLDQFPLLVFLSLITSPYSWTYDQVILIPAVIQVVAWIAADWKRWLTFFLEFLYLGINILDLILHKELSDFWFIWLAPALLVCYLLVRWQYSYPKTHLIKKTI
ncbi:MAG: glycosyltransferase family 87 protein [Anaerolineales bacterium]